MWISSYPKSGNTLVRALLASYFFSKDGIFNFEVIKNIKQFPHIGLFQNLGIDINDEIKLTLLNYKIPKGNKVTLKAHTSNFLEITNHKNYLERNLVKLYSTLSEGQTLLIPNLDNIILVDVLDCQPEKLISIMMDNDLKIENKN